MTTVPLAGVIGWPIGHSKSPRIHGHWLAEHGLAGHYVPLAVQAGDLGSALKTLPKLGFVGANVTLPHKEAALALADEASARARRIGAANTLSFVDGRVLADNTDGEGFLENLRQGAPDWEPAAGPALVLGAGGAARAILDALIGSGVPKILLANRTAARANALASEFGDTAEPIDWTTISDATEAAHTVVNTTALGMVGKPPLDITLRCRPGALVTDIVYTPLATPLLEQARAKGLVTVDGLGMLLHQAVPGFERWFGVRPTVTEALRKVVLA